MPNTNLTQTIPLALEKKKLFPSIFRFIPETLLYNSSGVFWLKIAVFAAASVLLMALTYNQYLLFTANKQRLTEVEIERSQAIKELAYWKDIASRYENFPDPYLKIALLEYKLGDTVSARDVVSKALSLNPEKEQGRVLGEFIIR